MRRYLVPAVSILMSVSLAAQSAPSAAPSNPWMSLMLKAKAHAEAHGARTPLLSPLDRTVVPVAFGLPGDTVAVPVADLQAQGIRVVPWTTNDPEKMRAVIRSGVDGLISDRPDLLQHVLAEERAARPNDPKLTHFVVSAHRGGRGLRPENTLPSFESGLDQLATELETDTGVSTDHVSLIWHDQFYNPQSCRRADGSAYTKEKLVYLQDISSADAQKTFICDQLHFGSDQKNDLALSPVAVAFAKQEHLVNPYVATYVAQLFRFVGFYVDYYSTGAGKGQPHAAERAANARTVRFNIETKIMPTITADSSELMKQLPPNHTVDPQTFVTTLAGVITKAGMTDRAAIQSFDFRTLVLVEEQFPKIPTFYLTESSHPPALQ
ncbi:MAG: glycerophosphodiester phosphodiesterase family protein [Janthinobacterium lividum]